jgi:hypothetical protein
MHSQGLTYRPWLFSRDDVLSGPPPIAEGFRRLWMVFAANPHPVFPPPAASGNPFLPDFTCTAKRCQCILGRKHHGRLPLVFPGATLPFYSNETAVSEWFAYRLFDPESEFA